MLPNFLIAGAAKAGTTALYYYLKQHPDIYMPDHIKETFFFTGLTPESFAGSNNLYGRNMVLDFEEYKSLFNKAHARKAVGEACVAYLYFYQSTIPRIVNFLGQEVKIIISLRDPVERAFSNYLHHVRDGIETLSFEDAVKAEGIRELNKWWWGFQYIKVGFYFNQVKAYLDTFGKDQTLILIYDDFKSNPSGVIKEIFQFLEVDDTFTPDLSLRYNVSGVPKNKTLHAFLTKPNLVKKILKPLIPKEQRLRVTTKLVNQNLIRPPLPPEIRNQLIDVYREDILKLQELIQRDLTNWLEK